MGRTALVLLAAVFVFTGAAPESDSTDVELQAEIGGQDLASADSNEPAELTPDTPTEVHLVVTNNSSEPVVVRSVRLEGSVLGLTFFNFETVVGMEVEPGEVEERTYELDLVGLDGQASGLIPAELQLLDPERSVLASEDFVADVDGSFTSVYMLFGLAVAIFTILTLVACCIGLARHTLSSNRFRRGLQFMVPGIGLGLTATFTLSALGIAAPVAALWLPLTLGFAIVLFVIGYLSPGPDGDDDDDDDDDDEDDDEEVVDDVEAQNDNTPDGLEAGSWGDPVASSDGAVLSDQDSQGEEPAIGSN